MAGNGALIAIVTLCMCAFCLCCMSSCSTALFHTCTKGTLDSDEFDSDACFTLPGPSPSPSSEEEVDTFPKDIEGLKGRYRFDQYSGGVWKDISGAGNDVDVTGDFTKMLYHDGAKRLYMLKGTHETTMRFPEKCMGTDKVYTFAYVGKYHGDKRGRIFDGSDVNWLSGWHSNRSGVAHHGGGAWVGGEPVENRGGQGLILGVDQKNMFRLNGVDRTKSGYTGGEAPTQITINDGIAKAGAWGGDGEVSDFALCEVLIYNRELSVSEIKKVEEYLQTTYMPDLPTGTIVAKGWEKTSTIENKEPWYKFSGTQEHCRQMANELDFKVWGHRNEKHSTPESRNTCFFYPDQFSATYTDDATDEVHTMGCADETKDPHKGCE